MRQNPKVYHWRPDRAAQDCGVIPLGIGPNSSFISASFVALSGVHAQLCVLEDKEDKEEIHVD
jgi:hypothetical protein